MYEMEATQCDKHILSDYMCKARLDEKIVKKAAWFETKSEAIYVMHLVMHWGA